MTDLPSDPGERDLATGKEAAPRLSLMDVARVHRLVLHRDLDNVGAAMPYLQAGSLCDLIETLWATPEAEFVRLAETLRFVPILQDQLPPEVRATDEQIEQLYEAVVERWARTGLGRFQWWFRRDEQRYDERSPRWNIELIVQAAYQEAAIFLSRCARHGWTPQGDTAITVLGVEAFRLAPALAPQFGAYKGIELRPKDVAIGGECLASHDIGNAELASIAGQRGALPACDLFYSVGALQYAPPPMMIDLLDAALRSLNEGGLAYVQLPCQIHGYAFDTERYLAGEGRDPSGEIHAIRQQDVLALMERHGLAVLEVFPDGALERFGLSYVFLGRKRR